MSLSLDNQAAGHSTLLTGSQEDLRTPRRMLWWSLLSVSIFVGWASQAEIDQITRAPAQVIASSRTQVVQSSDGGVIEEMRVREGDRVARGQLLVRFDSTKARAAYLETQAKASALRATVARLRAEVFGTPLEFGPQLDAYPQFKLNQLALLKKRQSSFNEEVEALTKQRELAQKELAMTEPLLKTGDVSMADVIRLQRQLTDVTAQITNRRNRYFQDAQADLSKAEEELAGLEQSLAQRKDQLDHTELHAPVHGVVKNVRITTIGGVVRPGEEVMQIVPVDDDLILEAKVRPADVAFLKPGLSSSIKIDAYDYTIYGSLEGQLSYISADTLSEEARQGDQQNYYRVQIKTLGRQFSGRPGEKLDIQTGMTGTVEIKTGSNTVLRYLTKPVIKTMSEAMTER